MKTTWWPNIAVAKYHADTCKHYIWWQVPHKAAVFATLAAHYAALELARREATNG